MLASGESLIIQKKKGVLNKDENTKHKKLKIVWR